MRFLSVSLGYHPDVLGGAWRVAAEQAVGLAARGHQVEVITAHPGGDLPDQEIRQGVKVLRYGQHSGNFFANWRAENRAAAALIRECLKEASKEVLLIQHHAYLEPAVATSPCRVLHIFHGPWAEEYRFAVRARARSWPRRTRDALIARILHRVEHRALRRADRVVVLSRHFGERLVEWHGRRVPRSEIVPGGVDLERFCPDADREGTRATWGLASEEFLTIALRRLDPRMGLNVVIDAFGRLTRDFPRARLWIAGRGPAEAGLRRQIEQGGLGNSVRLLGALSEADVPRLLRAADLALMPSLDLEGFGLATVEALACGTPVLGSRSGATPELLTPLQSDLLFEPGSATALAARWGEAMRIPASLPSRVRCAAFARERFSWNAQVEACERIAGTFLHGGRA